MFLSHHLLRQSLQKEADTTLTLWGVSVVVLISCSSKSVKPGLSVKTSGNSFTKFLTSCLSESFKSAEICTSVGVS